MNKQIAELLEQARTKDYWSEGRYLVDFINQEKFAKLIVMESVRVCNSMDKHQTPYDCADNLKEHFGIEE